jgi:hypothetical protein
MSWKNCCGAEVWIGEWHKTGAEQPSQVHGVIGLVQVLVGINVLILWIK